MDAAEFNPGLLALADQVYAALLDEWSDVDGLRRDPSAFTAAFERRLQEALEMLGDAYPNGEGDDRSDDPSGE